MACVNTKDTVGSSYSRSMATEGPLGLPGTFCKVQNALTAINTHHIRPGKESVTDCARPQNWQSRFLHQLAVYRWGTAWLLRNDQVVHQQRQPARGTISLFSIIRSQFCSKPSYQYQASSAAFKRPSVVTAVLCLLIVHTRR